MKRSEIYWKAYKEVRKVWRDKNYDVFTCNAISRLERFNTVNSKAEEEYRFLFEINKNDSKLWAMPFLLQNKTRMVMLLLAHEIEKSNGN